MATPGDAFSSNDLFRALYDSFLASGMSPQEAGYLAATFIEKSSLNTDAVAAYLNQAWNEIPATLPLNERAYFAWAILTAMRGNPNPFNALEQNNPLFKSLNLTVPQVANPDDPNLAYAQHYMLARYMAGKTGDANGTVKAVYSYDQLKRLAFQAKMGDALKTTAGHSPSPPTTQSVMWGVAGALRGQKDFTQANPGQKGDDLGTLKLLFPELLKKMLTSFNSEPGDSATAVCMAPGGPDAGMNVTGTLLSPSGAGAGAGASGGGDSGAPAA